MCPTGIELNSTSEQKRNFIARIAAGATVLYYLNFLFQSPTDFTGFDFPTSIILKDDMPPASTSSISTGELCAE